MNPSDCSPHLLTKITQILMKTFEDLNRICHLNPQNAEDIFRSEELQQELSRSHQRQENSQQSNSESAERSESEKQKSKEIVPKKQKVIEKSRSKAMKQDKKKKVAKWEIEGKPRPPLNAFMLFLKASKFEIMQTRPDLTPSQVSTYASSLWSELNEEEKEKYRIQYRTHRVKYDAQMKNYIGNEKQKKVHIITNKKKRTSQKRKLKTSKTEEGQEVVNIDSDDQNNSNSQQI